MSEDHEGALKQKFEHVAVEDTKVYTWHIADFDTLADRELSPVFECGGFRWQLLLFPRGNPNSQRSGLISLFLDCCGPVESDAQNWHSCCSFVLRMHNPSHPQVQVSKASYHRFWQNQSDWGYDQFCELRSAFVATGKHSAPLIQQNAESGKLEVDIQVDMDVLVDETGVMWRQLDDYDSKKETGYTGLVNQGATCYLNSLLQSLYFTKAFRSAVFKLPNSPGVAGGLQSVFFRLATSKLPVDTTDLTQAFGWDTADAFTQHDVQELARVLMDRLESKMKGTSMDGFLSKLFVGQMRSYIKCINVPFESRRSEDFWDIQLNVRGMKDVYASFQDYCAEELLTGDNKYAAGEYGLQDAVKGVIFEYMPPVLHLQLKRYDFDWMHEIQVKINDRYEFPLELDLSEFVNDKSRKWIFDLHGVLVHSGDLDAGHYYALIKPEASSSPSELDKGWFRFDDDTVTKAAIHEVLDDNFGGDERSALRRVTSAYMLVYVRRDDKDFVLPKTTDELEGLSPEVADKIREEHRLVEQRRLALEEKQKYLDVQVLTLDSLKNHLGTGVLPSYDNPSPEEEPKIERVRFGTPLRTLIDSQHAGSLWYASNHSRADSRALPHRLQRFPKGYDYSIDVLARTCGANPIVFFGPALGDTQMLVFVKQFRNNVLKIVGYKVIDSEKPLKNELEDLNLSENTVISVEVSQPNSVKLQNESDILAEISDFTPSAADYGIDDGDVLIVSSRGDNLRQYLTDLHSRVSLVLVRYRDVQQDEAQSDDMQVDEKSGQEEIMVDVKTTMGYEEIATKIAAALKCDPERLLLSSLPPNWLPSHILRSSGDNVSDLWNYCTDRVVNVLCRMLPVPLKVFESLCEIYVNWMPNGYMGTEVPKILLGKPEDPCVIDDYKQSDVIVRATRSGRRCKELISPTLGILSELVDEGWEIYAAPIPPLEKTARSAENIRLTLCVHFQGDPIRTHGVPFYFAVVPNEPFKDTKARIFQLLRNSNTVDRSLEKIRFAVIKENTFETSYITDDSVVLYDVLPQTAIFGLDHPVRIKNPYHQQAIHID